MTAAEGRAFAERMNSLFVEASAKTAVGVREAFQEVVEKIIDTPELWEASSAKGSRAGVKGKGGAAAGTADGRMPGTILIDEGEGEDGSANAAGGCSC